LLVSHAISKHIYLDENMKTYTRPKDGVQ